MREYDYEYCTVKCQTLTPFGTGDKSIYPDPNPSKPPQYDPGVVLNGAPSERSDDAGRSEGRLQGRKDDEHGGEGLHGLIVYSLYFI